MNFPSFSLLSSVQSPSGRRILWRSALAASVLAAGSFAQADPIDPRDDTSPWGISSSSEWHHEYPKFNPPLEQAGVRWMRYFNGWNGNQPNPGEYKWADEDAFVANNQQHHIRTSGIFVFFPKWASAKGDERGWPLKDIQLWRDYVTATVTRYHSQIKYWEVWNEFNSSTFFNKGTPQIYAEMVREAYIAAKKVDPNCKIGISCANFAVGFFDSTIKAGAAGYFDYVCVHPYENLEAVMNTRDGEMGFLSMASSIRKMLDANKQPSGMPLWITEMGYKTPIMADPQADALQSEALVKSYMLSMAQGIARVCWFEARGPSYGHNKDFGLIRKDWSMRPAYTTMKVMTGLMGPEPKYVGWLNMGTNGYGFVFQGKDAPVLCAWSAPESTNNVQFDTPTRIVDLTGKVDMLGARQPRVLTRTPVFVTGLSPQTVALAKSNAAKPFPWGVDYGKTDTVSCRLGATNQENGVKIFRPEGVTPFNMLEQSCLQTDVTKPGGVYLCFRVDPSFAGYGDTDMEVTIVARRISKDKPSGMKLLYENISGYNGNCNWWEIPEGDQWQEKTWRLQKANFVGGWGYNFRTDSVGAKNGFLIREVRVKKLKPAGL